MPKPPRGEDLPYDDGEPLESDRHRLQMNLLIESLREGWRDRSDFYVGGNMAIYFSETQSRRNDFRAPDVFVVLDTDPHERKRWVVWEEEGRTPDVIIELLSDSTEAVDRGAKMNLCARTLRVPSYVLFDPFTSELQVYRLDASRRYQRLTADGRGFVPCEPIGLWLGVLRSVQWGVDAPWLRWIDRSGAPLPTNGERAAQAEAELAALREELKRRG